MEKGWEQIVGALGVLYSGAAYLPLDPNLPQQRLWQLLDSGEVKWVVTQPWIQERTLWPAGIGCLTVEWDEAAEPIRQAEDSADRPTTGRPGLRSIYIRLDRHS